MTRNRTIEQWDRLAGTDQARGHIHPSGHISPEAYDESGRIDCGYALDAFGELSGLVMDYGCGDGRVAQHLRSHYRVLAVDASPRMLELANDRMGSSVDYHCWSGLVPWDREPVAAVFSTAVFIHHPSATGAKILGHLGGAVEPGAILAVQIPLYSEPREGRDHIDVTVWTLDQLIAAADAAGCDVVEAHWHEHRFTFDHIGENHRRVQVLRRRAI